MKEKPKIGDKVSCDGRLVAVHMDVKKETVGFTLMTPKDLGPAWRTGGKLMNCNVRVTFEVLEEAKE